MAHASKSSSDRLTHRFARIRPDGGEPIFFAVYCNTCGKFEAGKNVEDLVTKVTGWFIAGGTPGLDFCPDCRVDDGWAGSFPKPR